MADVTKELQAKITWDGQEAQDGITQQADSWGNFRDIVTGIIASDILINLFDGIRNIGEAALNSSASLQTLGVSADYAFGSNSAASQMLESINSLSTATPFMNEQLDQVAIRMQNMGVPTQQIQGDLKNLSNIASATGTSVSDMSSVLQTSGDVLALAYQRGSIASLQLRSIANSGIPIYDALVQVINKAGAGTAESAKAQEENAKKLAAAQAQQISLTQQLKNAQESLQFSQQQSPDSQLTLDKYNLSLQKAHETVDKLTQTLSINQRAQGTTAYALLAQQLSDAQQNLQDIEQAAPNTALAMDKYNFSIDKSKQTIADLNQKLLDNKTLLQQLSAAPGDITKSDLLNNTKNITISAQELSDAFKLIGQGRDLGAAKAQSETYTGTLKNLKQQWDETVDAILGVSQAGVVTKGSLFDTLTQQLQNLLGFLQENRSAIVAFGQSVINSFVTQVAPAIQFGFNWIVAHKQEIITFVQELAKAFVEFGVWMSTTGVPLLIGLGNDLLKLEPIISRIVDLLTQLAARWKEGIVTPQNPIGSPKFEGLWQKLGLPSFANGVDNFSGGLALVGEQGAEIVNLPQGSSVTPHNQVMPEVHIHNPVVRSQADIQAIVQQVKQALGRQNELSRLGAI